ncbi:cell division septal protein [Actinoalloteichus hymeniacidonis]|uniref:Cell division septal protein n=1 Tax=Actinoalloteichus hymeniacidonis TaxID=340345 RepID=A0AAC9MXT5_9PSEU|nr:cell division septal protein [Actinoalloteichus hymeniacidonis]
MAATGRGERRGGRADRARTRGSSPSRRRPTPSAKEPGRGARRVARTRSDGGGGVPRREPAPVRSVRGRSVRSSARRDRRRRSRRAPRTLRTILRDHVRPRGLLILLLAGLTVTAVLWYTPLLAVRAVEIVGNETMIEEEVREAAGVTMGTPMLRLDTETVHGRVAELPGIADVSVARSWPSTAVVTVVEREPVVLLRSADGLWLTDRQGIAYAMVDAPPAGLPELRVADPGPEDPATLDAVSVVDSLPAEVRSEVVSVSADSVNDIRLELSRGREVRWGEAVESRRKGRVLAALLTREGTVYDVAAPELPTIS